MKILVATRQTSDPACGDFAYAAEGEMVFKPERCDSPNHPDCEHCKHALAGTRTKYFTNTVKVVDAMAFRDETDTIHESIKGLREEAEKYEAGSVLEVRPDGLFLREGSHVWDEIIDDE